MNELDSNAKENMEFYKYLSSKLVDMKIDMYKKAIKDHALDTIGKDRDSIAIIIGVLEGLERTVDSAFSKCMCYYTKQLTLYSSIISRIDGFTKNKTDPDAIASFKFAKEILSNIHKEWQESRKDDSNGK